MTNKNLPDRISDAKKDIAHKPAGTNKPEMGPTPSVNHGGNSGSNPEANDERRGPARKSDPAVPNPGRDITTGSTGFDGQGRERTRDEERDRTSPDHMDESADREGGGNAAQEEHPTSEGKGTTA